MKIDMANKNCIGKNLLLILPLASFICLISSILFVSSASAMELVPGQSIGTLTVEKSSGGSIDLGKYGKPYVLAFFISGRKKDSAQLKELQKLLAGKEYKSFQGLAITRGIDSEEKATAKKFLAKNKITLPLIFDTRKNTAARKFGATSFPSFFAVDGNGILKAMAPTVTEKINHLSFSGFLSYIKAGKDIPFIDLLPRGQSTDKQKSLLGKPAPDFNLQEFNRKRSQSISGYKGKKNIILVFWSPGCPHCLKELPLIQNFYLSKRLDYNFEVIAITGGGGDEGRKMVENVVRQNMFTFPIIIDDKEAATKKYGIQYVPAVFFINKEGVVVDFLSGETQYFSQTFNSVFQDPGRLGAGGK